MSYKNQIQHCFGDQDYEFAIHPLDSIHARKLLVIAIKENVKWRELRSEIKEFLKSNHCQPKHIIKQMQRVSQLKNWLK